ncbi:MAG: saccharopine reductase [Bacteroidia bacterium]|nr:MAG: saccharopine reductase [Bacteroidia bacterium]
MAKIVVLGGGMVGSVIAQDLAKRHNVVVVDKSAHSLERMKNKRNIEVKQTDVREREMLKDIVEDADVVVTALPGFMGFEVLKNVIELGKSVADISFYPEDALSLDGLAKAKGVSVIVDCGVAPGMSNFLLGYHAGRMDVKEFICYVGGLPLERRFPFEYKAPFSPVDVIEEYTRPARIMEDGRIVIKPALSEVEMVDFEGVGTLEAFNTDGLRSLLYTMKVPNMKEKTLRYPGHVRLIEALKASGFFDEKKLEVDGCKVKPIGVTTALLKEAWKLKEEDEEFTIMRVIIKGTENGEEVTYQYDLLDRTDKATGFTSMSRTTGFTCAAMVELMVEGKFKQKGVYPPELIAGEEEVYKFMLDYLEDRGVRYKLRVSR